MYQPISWDSFYLSGRYAFWNKDHRSSDGEGFLYIATNGTFISHKGHFIEPLKFGMTRRCHVLDRMTSLSKDTGVYKNYECLFAIYCKNPREVENGVKGWLERVGLRYKKEFFLCDIEVIKKAIALYYSEYEEVKEKYPGQSDEDYSLILEYDAIKRYLKGEAVFCRGYGVSFTRTINLEGIESLFSAKKLKDAVNLARREAAWLKSEFDIYVEAQNGKVHP